MPPDLRHAEPLSQLGLPLAELIGRLQHQLRVRPRLLRLQSGAILGLRRFQLDVHLVSLVQALERGQPERVCPPGSRRCQQVTGSLRRQAPTARPPLPPRCRANRSSAKADASPGSHSSRPRLAALPDAIDGHQRKALGLLLRRRLPASRRARGRQGVRGEVGLDQRRWPVTQRTRYRKCDQQVGGNRDLAPRSAKLDGRVDATLRALDGSKQLGSFPKRNQNRIARFEETVS